MSNILVYDVAAENGGAVSILEYYYKMHKEDKENSYYYLLSIYKMAACDNIIVINFPEIKKSWLHRIVFDFYKAPRIIKKYKIDQVISLQNTIIPTFKGKQTVYMHNILPFAEYRYTLREDKQMWIYQNVISRVIYISLKRADHIIVQAEWIRKAIIEKIPQCVDKIEVQFPHVDIQRGLIYNKKHCRSFFYPAEAAPFKNHELIVRAAMHLKQKGLNDYEIIFTITGEEDKKIKHFRTKCDMEGLPIKWRGRLSREEVLKLYTESILVFPSYIETVGLPLYEAKQISTPILAADCEYAHEVLKGYSKAVFFNWKSAEELAFCMEGKLRENDA